MAVDAWAVQVAAYDLLVAANLPNVVTIVDTLPGEGDTYPYVLIGESQSISNDATGAAGDEIFLDFHIYSQAKNQMEMKRIMGAMTGALHDQSLAVAGLTSCFSYRETTRTFDDPDGLTRHGVLTAKFICHE